MCQSLEIITHGLKVILELLETESNPLILEKLFGDTYASESIWQYKATTQKIADKLQLFSKKIGFSLLKTICYDNFHKPKQVPKKQYPNRFQFPKAVSEIPKHSFLEQILLRISAGDNLTKIHYTSSGSKTQYFLPYKNTSLKWASKPSSIYKDKPSHVVNFSDIKGVVYGHVTKTFQKSSNMKK